MGSPRVSAILTLWLGAAVAAAQTQEHDHSQMDHSQMAGHTGMDHSMHMNPAAMYLMSMASGTSMEPQSWPMPMLMPHLGSWHLMLMGQAFLVDTQQSGPRGHDKLYSSNWIMTSALHQLGKGSIMLQGMFSLEPATVTNKRYPLLFQTGETANGIPLVDAQHPHDFFMSLAVQYARPLSENTMLQFYYAPVGDPALGPVAFPHRASAFDLPQATLGHHWQDSTHIADNVATVALKHKWFRLEASGFYGTEPDEHRWNIDWGPMNSYSARVSVFPQKNWMAQFSAGQLSSPEPPPPGILEAGDVVRTTASIHYTKPIRDSGAWSTSFIWGRNHETDTHHDLDSYLLESLYPLTKKNSITGRLEIVDKDELISNELFRIQAYTLGYTREIARFNNIAAGIGANVTGYRIPPGMKPSYGDHPWGVNVYLRFRLTKPQT